MPIKGKTDRLTLEERDITGRSSPVAVTLHKGEKKTGNKENTRAGQDLKDKWRWEASSAGIQNLMMENYGDRPTHINIYLTGEKVEQVWDAYMQKRRSGGIEFLCDRDRIYKECNLVPGRSGTFQQWKDCDRPCECKDIPKPNCQSTGILTFKIRELYNAGYKSPVCKLYVSGSHDLDFISRALYDLEREFGSFYTPMPCPFTNGYLPLVLTRSETKIQRPEVSSKDGKHTRTGKYVRGSYWAVCLQLDPNFRMALMLWRQMEQLALQQQEISGTFIESYRDSIRPLVPPDLARIIGKEVPLALPSGAIAPPSSIIDVIPEQVQQATEAAPF